MKNYLFEYYKMYPVEVNFVILVVVFFVFFYFEFY